MRDTFIALVMPKIAIAIVSRAIAGTDIPNRTSGRKNAPAGHQTPMTIPAATPMTPAQAYPATKRARLGMTFSRNSSLVNSVRGSGANHSCAIVATICEIGGTNSECASRAATSQTTSSTTASHVQSTTLRINALTCAPRA